MYRLFIHDDAKSDLEELWNQSAKSAQAAARITVLLEEIEGNQDLLDRLTQHDFGCHNSAEIHVSKWQEQWRAGKNLWRIKAWDLEKKGLKYRIVYAFIPGKSHYHVLAIAPREFNYESTHPLTRRIIKAYEYL